MATARWCPRLEKAALRALRVGLAEAGGSAAFDEVRVHRFGPAGERAVCGRIAPGAGRADPIDFVVRVVLPDPARPGAPPLAVVEQGPGVVRSAADAWARHCQEAPDPPSGGGPAGAPAPGIAAAIGGGGAAGSGAAGSGAAGSGAAGSGAAAAPVEGGPVPRERVAVRPASPANLRAGPGGGARVLGTLPRGRVLAVFERAPGGWVRVGDAEPLGWVHASMLAPAPAPALASGP